MSIKLLCLVLLLWPLYTLSNDSRATIAAQNITYEITDDISMESEELKISVNNITVTYGFFNHSNKVITFNVAFPLPPSPLTLCERSNVFPEWDETYHAYSYINEHESIQNDGTQINTLGQRLNNAAFTNFKRTVNGKPYGFDEAVKAIDKNGNDITNLLRQHKIPLSSLYLGGFWDIPGIEKDPTLKKKLINLNLLDDNMLPVWQTQIIYHWKQSFPPHKTITTSHSYKPHTGEHWLSAQLNQDHQIRIEDLQIYHRGDVDSNYQPETKKLSGYTISEQDRQTILGMFNKTAAEQKESDVDKNKINYRIKEVRYILSTGANWKGRIKSFSLDIIPPIKNCIVLASFDGVIKKNKKGHYIAKIKNFKPKKDLKVLFIGPDL